MVQIKCNEQAVDKVATNGNIIVFFISFVLSMSQDVGCMRLFNTNMIMLLLSSMLLY